MKNIIIRRTAAATNTYSVSDTATSFTGGVTKETVVLGLTLRQFSVLAFVHQCTVLPLE